MAYRIQKRRDYRANWETINPILLEGEEGFVLDDPNLFKIGDGVHTWNELPYRGYTGTIAQTLGNNENAVASQKVVTEKFTEQDKKLSDIGSEMEVITLNGAGVKGVFQYYKGCIPNHIYKIYPKDRDWDIDGLADNRSKFQLYYTNDNGDVTVIESVGRASLSSEYIFKAPDNVDKFYIYIRANKGTELTFTITDVTENQAIEENVKVVTLYGEGSKGVFQKITVSNKSAVYRVYNNNGDWESPSANLGKLQLYYATGVGETVVPINVKNSNTVNDWYDIYIPENIGNLYVYIWANKNKKLSFVIEEVKNQGIGFKNRINIDDNFIGEDSYIFKNGYIPFSGGGVTDIDSPSYTSPNYLHTIVKVEKGDNFLIKGKGGSSALLFTLLDSEKKVLTYSTTNADYSQTLYPFYCYQNGYLVINVDCNYDFGLIKLDKSIYKCKDVISLDGITQLTDGYINHINGTRIDSSTLNYKTNYLPTLGFKTIKITVNTVMSDTVTTGLAFYDINRQYISGISSVTKKESVSVIIEEYSIPDNAYTFASTIFKEYSSNLIIELNTKELERKEVKLEHNGLFNGYINSKGANLGVIATSTQNQVTGRIDVSCVSELRLLMNYGINSANTTGLVFFDKNNNVVSGYTSPYNEGGTETESIEQIIQVPNNAEYAITTIRNEFKDKFYVFGIKSKNMELSATINKVSYYREDLSFHKRYSNCVDFGTQPSADGLGDSFCNVKSSGYNQLLSDVYEPLRADNTNYIKRTSIGYDSSGTIEMFAYEFEPRYYQQHVYLQAGIHGNEPDAIACLARIMQMITNATDEQHDLMFLRQNVKFTVVPCVNVWGFSQSPKKRQTIDDRNMQQWNSSNESAPSEIVNIRNFVEDILPELSFMVDMHTTTNDTYYDFYANIQPNAKNVRTIYRTNAWLCDRYALNGRTVDDQYIGYDQGDNSVFRRYYYNKGVETATIELSDYHWDSSLSTSKVITMGVTMFLNYIIQMCNDFYKSMYNIPYEDYRESRG